MGDFVHNGYRGKIVRVVDGDTVDAMIDLGFNTWVKRRIRFHGLDTWECRTRNLDFFRENPGFLSDNLGFLQRKPEFSGVYVHICRHTDHIWYYLEIFKGNYAIYTRKDNIIKLTGDVSIKSPTRLLTGSELIADIDNNKRILNSTNNESLVEVLLENDAND